MQNRSAIRFVTSVLLVFFLLTSSVSAQALPPAPSETSTTEPQVTVNHFEGRFAPTVLDQSFGILPRTVHGLIYDVNGVYNFGRGPLFGSSFFPYVTAGIGGLSTLVDNGSTALIDGLHNECNGNARSRYGTQSRRGRQHCIFQRQLWCWNQNLDR